MGNNPSINPEASSRTKPDSSNGDLARVLEEVEQAIRSVAYGSVEVVIQNSRVVQIERREKFRFNGS
jgi:hypothetical protein